MLCWMHAGIPEILPRWYYKLFDYKYFYKHVEINVRKMPQEIKLVRVHLSPAHQKLFSLSKLLIFMWKCNYARARYFWFELHN